MRGLPTARRFSARYVLRCNNGRSQARCRERQAGAREPSGPGQAELLIRRVGKASKYGPGGRAGVATVLMSDNSPPRRKLFFLLPHKHR
jgi:hypothetical protein